MTIPPHKNEAKKEGKKHRAKSTNEAKSRKVLCLESRIANKGLEQNPIIYLCKKWRKNWVRFGLVGGYSLSFVCCTSTLPQMSCRSETTAE